MTFFFIFSSFVLETNQTKVVTRANLIKMKSQKNPRATKKLKRKARKMVKHPKPTVKNQVNPRTKQRKSLEMHKNELKHLKKYRKKMSLKRVSSMLLVKKKTRFLNNLLLRLAVASEQSTTPITTQLKASKSRSSFRVSRTQTKKWESFKTP